MAIHKLTTGYVLQKYDEGSGDCISQEFIASDEVVYENEYGETAEAVEGEAYCPLDMVQPQHRSRPPAQEVATNG